MQTPSLTPIKRQHRIHAPLALSSVESLSAPFATQTWRFVFAALTLITAITLAAPSYAQPSMLDPTITQVSAGSDHACALTAAGAMKCWGQNIYGQLGIGSTTNQLTPVEVTGLASGVSAIIPGNRHTCALTTAGGVQCWGYNTRGQLGDGSTTDF